MVKDEKIIRQILIAHLSHPTVAPSFSAMHDSVEDDDEEAILGRKQGAMIKVNHTIF